MQCISPGERFTTSTLGTHSFVEHAGGNIGLWKHLNVLFPKVTWALGKAEKNTVVFGIHPTSSPFCVCGFFPRTFIKGKCSSNCRYTYWSHVFKKKKKRTYLLVFYFFSDFPTPENEEQFWLLTYFNFPFDPEIIFYINKHMLYLDYGKLF